MLVSEWKRIAEVGISEEWEKYKLGFRRKIMNKVGMKFTEKRSSKGNENFVVELFQQRFLFYIKYKQS